MADEERKTDRARERVSPNRRLFDFGSIACSFLLSFFTLSFSFCCHAIAYTESCTVCCIRLPYSSDMHSCPFVSFMHRTQKGQTGSIPVLFFSFLLHSSILLFF